MLLPIVMAVVNQTSNHRLSVSLLLGTAYGASVGGIGTPIGTPPNVIFMGVFREQFATDVGFVDWMIWVVPIIIVMLPIVGFWLTRGGIPMDPVRLPAVGNWRPEEVRTLTVFGITAVLWMTRQHPFGGWAMLATQLGAPMPYANEATVALLGAVAMFLVPNGQAPGEKLLDWETAVKVPWGILILFAGGICMAGAFKESGLSAALGETLASLGTLPTLLLIGSICLGVTFLTEVTSNTATTTLLLPILATAANCGRSRAENFHDPGDDQCQFCIYAARRHAAQCHCIRLRPIKRATNGPRGICVESLWSCRRDCDLLSDVSLGQVL